MKRAISLFVLTIILFKLVSFWIISSSRFTRPFDPIDIGKLYSESQYVIGEKSVGGIGDDGLYAFAGYYYFFQGGDVSSVNFEHPPLGKYLIGLSIFLFKNENVISIFYFLLLLLITYKIGMIILKDSLLSLFAVMVLSMEPIFLDHTIRSQLDLPFTLFFCLAVYLYLKIYKNYKYLFLSQFFWGLAFSTRFFPFLLVLQVYLLITTFLYHKKHVYTFIKSSILIPLTYTIFHISFFVYHPSVIEFIRHKKWMLAWFTGTPIIVGNILRNIFTGSYLDSTGALAYNEHWHLFIPLTVILAYTSLRRNLLSKITAEFNVLYGLVLIYFLYLIILTGGAAKFMMPVYPVLIILAVRNLNSLYSIIRSCWIKSLHLLKAK